MDVLKTVLVVGSVVDVKPVVVVGSAGRFKTGVVVGSVVVGLKQLWLCLLVQFVDVIKDCGLLLQCRC